MDEPEKNVASSKQNSVNTSTDTSAPVVPTETEVLRTLVKEYTAHENAASRLQRRNFCLSVITASLIFGYTTVAALQWCQMKKATRASQASAKAAQHAADTSARALHSSYRPWVGPDLKPIVIGSIHQAPSKVNLRFELKNSGTSVALGVQDAFWISDDFNIFHSDNCKKMAATEKQAIYLAHKTGGKAGGVTPETGQVIFPNGILTSQEPPQAGAPLKPTANVYALLCIAYFDQFDVVHFTKLIYCFTPWPLPAWKDLPLSCKQGNYAD